MNIILNEADFSTNNIGQVLVPNEYAAAAFENYSNLTDEAKVGLNTFLDTLIDSGIMSKLSYMYIPVIGSTVSELLYNIVEKKKNTVLGEGNLSISNGYLYKNVTGSSFSMATVIYFDKGFDVKNYSFVYIPCSNAGVTGGGSHRLFMGGSGYEIYPAIVNRLQAIASDPKFKLPTKYSTPKSVIGVSIDSANSSFLYSSTAELGSIEPPVTYASTATDYKYYCFGGFCVLNDRHSLGDSEIQNLTIFGESLTQTELDTLVSAAGTFATLIGLIP